MNKDLVDRLTRKRLKVKTYTKKEAKVLAKSMGLKLSDNFMSEEEKQAALEKEDAKVAVIEVG